MKYFQVVWDKRLGKQERFEADEYEWAKTGSIVKLIKDDRTVALVSNFQSITIIYPPGEE